MRFDAMLQHQAAPLTHAPSCHTHRPGFTSTPTPIGKPYCHATCSCHQDVTSADSEA